MKYNACEKCANSVGQVNIAGNIMMIVIKGYMGVAGGSPLHELLKQLRLLLS